VTFFCGILNIRTGEVEYSNGGHNLPYYIHRRGVSPLERLGGMSLGLVEASPYESARMVLRPGEALLLYTDGVTEAMDSSKTLYSEERLEQFLAVAGGSEPRRLIGDLIGDVRQFAGDAAQSDDITVLALQYFGTLTKVSADIEIKLHNKLAEVARVNETLTEFGRQRGLSDVVLNDLKLALGEILTNIISYGYTDGGEHEIRVSLGAEAEAVTVAVEDDGHPFNPLEAPAPDTSRPLEERAIGGMGIHLVRKLMDGLEYQRREGKNLLILKKHLC
jgi:sigma-B regulation protein RsbU (phosphoserine phosphatase)